MRRHLVQLIILLSFTNVISCEEDSCICAINSEKTANCSHKYLVTIPVCVLDTTKTLILTDNKLKYRPKQFERFKYLIYLNLSLNYGFKPNKFSFAGLSKLKSLSLEANGIDTLLNGTFDGLHNLQILSLSYNLLTEIRNYQFSGLSNLTHLYLDRYYGDKHLYNYSFSGLYQLRYLSLKCTYADVDVTIELDTFKPLTNLEELHIEGWCSTSKNYYNCSNIDEILSKVPSLKRLYLDADLIANLGPGFALLKNLEELYFLGNSKIGRNALSELTFDNLKNAVVCRLTLYQCLIQNIYPNAFACLKNLTALELFLSTTHCNDGFVYDQFATGLSDTRIKYIRLSLQCQGPLRYVRKLDGLKETHLVSLDLSYGPLDTLDGLFFQDLPSSLQYLYLHHNRISRMSPEALSKLQRLNLVVLDLSNQLDMNNEYAFLSSTNNRNHSTLPELQDQYSYSNHECYILPYTLKHLSVSNSSLLCNYMYNICESNNSLVSLKASYQRSLDCFDKFWNSLRSLSMLEKLDLRGNRIKSISSWAFSHLKHLKYLSLSNNVLLVISFELQSAELKYLDLSENSIRYLSTPFTTNIDNIAGNSNLTIYLSNNPLVCDCDRIKFAAWLHSTHVIYKKDLLNCTYENRTETQLNNIAEIHNSLEVQCIVFDVTVACVVGFVALNILFGLTALIWHRRWQMRYLFSIARRSISPYHPLEEKEIQLEYDVYISYEGDFNVTVNESLHQFVASKV